MIRFSVSVSGILAFEIFFFYVTVQLIVLQILMTSALRWEPNPENVDVK